MENEVNPEIYSSQQSVDNPLTKKSHLWLFIAFGIVIPIVLGFSYFLIINNLDKNLEEKSIKLNLGLTKCYQSCPHEQYPINKSGMENLDSEGVRKEYGDLSYYSEASAECTDSCNQEWSKIAQGFISPSDKIGTDAVQINSQTINCRKEHTEEGYKNCLQKILDNYSNYEPELLLAEYEIFNLTILNLTCSGNHASVNLILNKGNIDGLDFLLLSRGSIESVKRSGRIAQGEEKTFTLESTTLLSPIERIEIYPLIENKTSSKNFKFSC